MVGGMPIWEAMPGVRHQREVRRIELSIKRSPGGGQDCGCLAFSDVPIRFPEGSYKRPDVSVFCREPDEQDEAVTLLPEAVIEVLSPGYEDKDLKSGVPFYLAQAVKDVIVLDPRTHEVRHYQGLSERLHSSPVVIALTCGCSVTV